MGSKIPALPYSQCQAVSSDARPKATTTRSTSVATNVSPISHNDPARILFEETLERIRQRHQFFVFGYCIMPTHVHLVLSEPKLHPLATTLSVLKGETSKLLKGDRIQFWQSRYYDFNILTHKKHIPMPIKLFAAVAIPETP